MSSEAVQLVRVNVPDFGAGSLYTGAAWDFFPSPSLPHDFTTSLQWSPPKTSPRFRCGDDVQRDII